MSVRQELKKRRTWLLAKGDWETHSADQIADLRGRPDGDDTAHAVIAIASGLASYLGVRGELAVVDGDGGGWVDVQRSLQLWKLRIEIERELYARGASRAQGLEPSSALVTLCAAAAISLRRGDDEAWLRQVMTAMIEDTRMVRPKWWVEHPVASFVARQLGMGVAANVKPPHREVLANGNDDRQLGKWLTAACDYHAEHMTIGNQGHEFADGPFGLIPFELLAVLELRRRAGRPLPVISHELVAGGVATWAEVEMIAVDDSLLAALATRSMPPVAR